MRQNWETHDYCLSRSHYTDHDGGVELKFVITFLLSQSCTLLHKNGIRYREIE